MDGLRASMNPRILFYWAGAAEWFSPIPANGPAGERNLHCLLLPGKTLFWTVQDTGKPGNAGTLRIISANSKSGAWSGEQIVQTKVGAKTKLTGKFEGSTVLISHPSQSETWFGACDSQKISGLIKTSYPSQLKFEIWK